MPGRIASTGASGSTDSSNRFVRQTVSDGAEWEPDLHIA
jgi:hypothetical protein